MIAAQKTPTVNFMQNFISVSIPLLQMKCLDYTEVVDESGLTGIQTNKLFWRFTQVSTSSP